MCGGLGRYLLAEPFKGGNRFGSHRSFGLSQTGSDYLGRGLVTSDEDGNGYVNDNEPGNAAKEASGQLLVAALTPNSEAGDDEGHN